MINKFELIQSIISKSKNEGFATINMLFIKQLIERYDVNDKQFNMLKKTDILKYEFYNTRLKQIYSELNGRVVIRYIVYKKQQLFYIKTII